ncbi:hypothetical protein ABTZ46_25800 [Nocardioides sp. NPDC126508]
MADPPEGVTPDGLIRTGARRDRVPAVYEPVLAYVLGRVPPEASAAFAEVCRGVEIAAMTPDDYAGEGDEAYGNRVFLRHYCAHLAGPDPGAERRPPPGGASSSPPSRQI